MINEPPTHIAILGAGVIGLTTALTLSNAYPHAKLTIIATHFPGDRSISYASPWAGANWSSMATDNGPLENYDAVTYKRFGQLMDGESVHGCKVENVGEGNEAGLGRQGMWAVFDSPIEEAGILSEGTGKVWYDELVGGLRKLTRGEMPEEAEFGFEVPRTFRINTQIYLQWLQSQVLLKGAHLIRRQYTSLTQLLTDVPSTSLLINCSGLGSLNLTDIRDTNLYPTRGQTLLIAEPKEPIERMYLRSPKRVDPTVTYIFPRTHGGGVILGGSRDDNNWSEEWDEELGDEILHRATTLLPSLGTPSTLRSRIISRNVGLRPSRKGGPRIEKEIGRWRVPVVHCYGHAGAGFQSSWGTAERVLEIVQGLGKVRAKL